jgi:hypothetical protein
VAGAEDMGHVPQVDEQLDHLARVEEFCLGHVVTVAAADDALGEVGAVAVGLDVDELGGEIGVPRAGRGGQPDRNRPGDRDRGDQVGRGVDQDVVTFLDPRLVLYAARAERGA